MTTEIIQHDASRYCRVTLHDEGPVTYWSVYEQRWITAGYVPDRELAAMLHPTRERVKAHLSH